LLLDYYLWQIYNLSAMKNIFALLALAEYPAKEAYLLQMPVESLGKHRSLRERQVSQAFDIRGAGQTSGGESLMAMISRE
jgi:hypothetical protein